MNTEEYIGKDMLHTQTLALHHGGHVADEKLCVYAIESMSEKLKETREIKGRDGWYTDDCSIDYLKRMLEELVQKDDMVDVMNVAAMIHFKRAMEKQKQDVLDKHG